MVRMSRIYIISLAIAAVTISTVGAVFSIVGLTSLFAGANISVGIMAGSLEFAKLVTAGFLYRYWGHINQTMRLYLSTAVVILSVITSMGIFGYLSHAYQKSSFETKTIQLEMEALEKRKLALQEEISKTEKFISEIPLTRISKKFALYEESKNQNKALLAEIDGIQLKINSLKERTLELQTEIGPLIYISEATSLPVDTIAKFLILVFVSVFDPLAICLVFAVNLAVRIREKYRGDESRIGNLAIVKPVDHRFKKSA